MTVECLVFRSRQSSSPETFKFVALPRVGEGISLPGSLDGYIVESIRHTASEPGGQDLPTVQMYLRALPRRKL
jgi:hypothetical protein